MGSSIAVALPVDLVRSRKSLARACGATLFTVVLAAWKARPAARLHGGPHAALACPGHLCSASSTMCPVILTCCSRQEVGRGDGAEAAGASTCSVRGGCAQVLLGQHSGRRDIVNTTSVAGRSAPELEPLIGVERPL